MAHNLQGQGNYQVQTQVQTLSPQQVMVARLTELPVDALRERIEKELDDNSWLETKADHDEEHSTQGVEGNTAENQDEDSRETHELVEGPRDETDERFDDDFIPNPNNGNEEVHQREINDQEESFFDHLTNQMSEYELDEHQKEVMRYLIGSLEDDGFLRTSLLQIQDELDIYQGIQTSLEELEQLLGIIQQMDPAGAGARNLQECFTIQAKRNYQGEDRDQLVKLFTRYWDDFAHLRWDRIKKVLKLDELQLDQLRRHIRRLNPRPGGSIGSSMHNDNHAIIPDFYVEMDDLGKLRVALNEGDLPQLIVSPDAETSLSMPAVSKAEKEALKYMRDRVENAQMFIDAIAQRRRTMLLTMKAIIKLQRPFFLEGDETLLAPMKLEDVAALTGLDISTISRVSNSKYVQTTHGTYPLRWFFTSAAMQDGESVSVRAILDSLKNLVQNEDKKQPLSDEKLVQLLREKGFAVARRTVTKYRTQLGIAESRMRKE